MQKLIYTSKYIYCMLFSTNSVRYTLEGYLCRTDHCTDRSTMMFLHVLLVETNTCSW